MLYKHTISRFVLLLFFTSGLLGCLGDSHNNTLDTSNNEENSNNDTSGNDSKNDNNTPVDNINDGNTTYTIQFKASAFDVDEGGGTASITVIRNGDVSKTASVDYSTRAETATAGEDYTAVSGTLSFAASETEKSFSVDVTNDNAVESDETVILMLTNPSDGFSLGTDRATLTITDNDENEPVDAAFSISGMITASANSAIDGDVNDSFAPYTSNDDSASAQQLPNPVTLGGFASAVGSGGDGDRFAAIGDKVDWYIVTLAANQTVTLSISDHLSTNPNAIDLDLFLYDPANTDTPMRSSLGNGPVEFITSADAGTYYLKVHAVAGISNYILTIGQSAASVPTDILRLEQEFVPGEIVVKFKDALKTVSAKKTLQNKAAALGMLLKQGGAGYASLFELTGTEQRRRTLPTLGLNTKDETSSRLGISDPELKRKYETIKAINALRARTDVKYAEPNYIMHTMTEPNDSRYSSQWHYPLINLPQAWDITTGTPVSGSVIVAVVDTGVFLNHPDLSDKLVSGYDFVRDDTSSADGEPGIDNNPDDPGGSFHGTHVAGTVAAQTDNSIGVAGVSWGAKIMPIRVLGTDGSGTTFDVMQGVRYAAGLSNVSKAMPAQPADIINLSLGANFFSQDQQDTYNDVRNAGVIVIAAAGNDGKKTMSYPASYDGVVSVSAVDKDKQRASYSNYSSAVDAAAPGGSSAAGVLSTLVDVSTGTRQPAYARYIGTSMATPHMAGVVALMKAVYPGLTPDELDSLLQAGLITEDLGSIGRDDEYGNGLIDALKAVEQAQLLAQGNPMPPVLKINPTSLTFGYSDTSSTLTAENAGDGSLTVISVTEDSGGWLSISPASGLGEYTISVDRTGLADGRYSAAITFTSSANTVMIPVTMQVGSPLNIAADAGFHWIILFDAQSGSDVDTISATAANGAYSFNFTDVTPGEYYVFAGTDSDNDFAICDAGEACGAYPDLNQPMPVTVVDRNVTDIDFFTGFNLGVGTALTRSNLRSDRVLQRAPLQRSPQ
jgi:serine protease